VYRFIIEPVMISNGVLQSAAQPISTSSPQGAQLLLAEKNFDKASSCSVVGCEVHWHGSGYLTAEMRGFRRAPWLCYDGSRR